MKELKEKLDWFWLASCGLITAVAAFLRFFWLELKPLHHDEGVNGYFLETLYDKGIYKYDPSNYHGPDLYYIALAFTKAFGLNTVSIRMSVAVFGLLMVILVFFFRDYLGRIGTLTAAMLVALSPGMVFISRYFIHEIIFVFLTLGILLSVVLYIDRKKAGPFAVAWAALICVIAFVPTTLSLASAIGGNSSTVYWGAVAVLAVVDLTLIAILLRTMLEWDGGRHIYLMLASASLVLLFATKETGFISVGTMIIAWACVTLWRKIGPGVFGKMGDEAPSSALTFTNFKAALGTGDTRRWAVVIAAAVFVYLGVLFFSSFFTHPRGVIDAFRAYFFWTKTGTGDHVNGFFAYVKWALKIETAILLLSAVGAGIALIRGSNRFAVFCAFWAFGMLAAYTIIPYKTPWLALSFVLPMCLVAGYAVERTLGSRDTLIKALGAVLGIAAAATLSYQAYTLNFVGYDDEKMPYVYAHTRRGFLDMVREIEAVGEASGKGLDARIEIVSPDYWPLPWYLRNHKAKTFYGTFTDARGAEMIVAKVGEKEDELLRRYGSEYRIQGRYPLRPGVDLFLLVRNDLAGSLSIAVSQGIRQR